MFATVLPYMAVYSVMYTCYRFSLSFAVPFILLCTLLLTAIAYVVLMVILSFASNDLVDSFGCLSIVENHQGTATVFFFSSPEPYNQGELIVYPCSGVRPPIIRLSTISKDLLCNCLVNQSQNFLWNLVGKRGGGGESLYKWARSHDQDGHRPHTW